MKSCPDLLIGPSLLFALYTSSLVTQSDWLVALRILRETVVRETPENEPYPGSFFSSLLLFCEASGQFCLYFNNQRSYQPMEMTAGFSASNSSRNTPGNLSDSRLDIEWNLSLWNVLVTQQPMELWTKETAAKFSASQTTIHAILIVVESGCWGGWRSVRGIFHPQKLGMFFHLSSSIHIYSFHTLY